MACKFDLNSISQEEISIIMNALTLIPVNKREEDAKKWGNKSTYVYTESKNPIVMYLIKDNKLFLPFRFACGLYKKIFNSDHNHLRIINNNIPKFTATLRDYQIPQGIEAYQYLQSYNTVTIGLPPGEGKTMLGSFLLYNIGLMTLILVPREKLLGQWYETIKKSIPDILEYVWIVGVTNPPKIGLPAIIICMNTRTHYIPQHYKDSIGTLIIDEAHMFCTPSMVECLLCVEPRYIILESATMERTDGMEVMMQAIAGTHGIYKVSIKPYKVHKIETDVIVEEVQNKFGTNYSDLVNKTLSNNDYNFIILNIIKCNLQHKYIVLTKLVEHANNLCRWLNELGIKSDTLVGNKNNYNDSKVLIGTAGKIGTGFDVETSAIDYDGIKANVVIIIPSTKEYQAYEQQRGRGMRADNPIVVWINTRNKSIRNHFNGLKNWIEATNGQIITQKFETDKIVL